MRPAPNPDVPSDPLLQLLPSEPPWSFLDLPPAERAWRGRFSLMTWSMGGTTVFSWSMALNDTPIHNAEVIAIVANTPDERIRYEVERRRAEDQAGV